MHYFNLKSGTQEVGHFTLKPIIELLMLLIYGEERRLLKIFSKMYYLSHQNMGELTLIL